MNISNLIKNINNNFNKNKLIDLIPYIQNYNSTDYKKYINLKKNAYNRTLIYKNYDFDIYLITWDKKCKSKIHNHSENGCIVKVLEGSLIENIYNKELEKVKTNILPKKSVSFISNNIGFHNIINDTDNISMSLHIYSPPNHKTKYFN